MRMHLNKCIVCKYEKINTYRPKIDNLTEFRLNTHTVFEATACDFWGPIFCKHGPCNAAKGECYHEGVKKVYGLVFTCLSTRYCQLYLADNTKTDTFMRLFNQLCSRFGRPKFLISDNASYFRSAKTLLRKIFNEKIAKEQNLDWILSTQYSPHSNGAVEKLNHIIKSKIMRILKNAMLTHQQVFDLFDEVTGMVNSRPLAAQINGNNIDNVSPNMLVFGKNFDLFNDCRSTRNNILDAKTDFIKQLRHRRLLLNSMWRSFAQSYVEDMTLRTKFKDDGSQRQAAINDVVFFFDTRPKKKKTKGVKRVKGVKEPPTTSSPRSSWLIGRITEVFPDKLGIVRKARVLLRDGNSYVRSTRSIAFLETMESD